MTKKLIIMGILMIPFLLLTRMATAQSYEKMSPSIQAKMDRNKLEGKESLSEIYTHYEIQFGGIKDTASAEKLVKILNEKIGAVNFEYDASTKHISFSCPAKYNLKSMKSFIKNDGFEINSLFKEEYSLNKN